jgi:hypothetical protein
MNSTIFYTGILFRSKHYYLPCYSYYFAPFCGVPNLAHIEGDGASILLGFAKVIRRAIDKWLKAGVFALKLTGHAQYYYMRGNSSTVARFYHEARKIWRK